MLKNHVRWIMHVDMDAFYASVEQLDHEEYRGKPVIVAGIGKRGVVSTCSYEARKFGVHSAMPTAKALKLCPQGIFVEGNFKRYGEVSRAIFKIFDDYSPLVEPLSIDEAFLDITGMENLMASPKEYAQRLKAEILEKTGIVASVGIAPNKFLAKIASDLEKPNGLTIIPHDKVQECLDPLPVKRIWGVGAKLNHQLSLLGINTIGQLRQADYKRLVKQVGDNRAQKLTQLAQGLDDRPVAPRDKAKSIGHEVTFGEDLYCQEDEEQVLLDLAVRVGWRLRQAGFKAKTVQLKLRKGDFTTYTRQKQLYDASNFDEDIFQAVVELFRELGIYAGIRLLGVSTTGFDAPDMGSLFTDTTKKQNLYDALDSINQRFGKQGVIRAKLLKK